jgi:hypothetical protein
MQAPSPAYHRMRAAYAGWFWKTPAGALVTAVGALLLARGRTLWGLSWLVAGIVLLMDAARARAVYEVNRAEYDAEVPS